MKKTRLTRGLTGRTIVPAEAIAIILFPLLSIFSQSKVSAQSPIMFADVTDESGIRFQHYSGGTGKHFIVETVTAGIATLDYNNDGLLDLYLLNGAPLLDAQPDWQPTNRLYRNDGGFRFTDVTQSAGAMDQGFALGVVAGDYDNDGDDDLFISNFGATVLLENNGDGTFSRRQFASPAKPRVGAGLALLDLEHDGDLDLYVANYIDFSFDKDVNRKIFGVPAAPGPKDYEPDTDCLYENLGDGGYADISDVAGVTAVAGAGMGVVALDYDEDGDSDLFVCNDSAANFLFENQGDKTFVENALIAGVAYDVTGAGQASMGVDLADVDRDGHIDLVTTNFMDEIPTLYKNSGIGFFDDVGAGYGLGVADRSVSWGVGLSDLDNDSWPDLFIAAGHLIEGISRVNDSEQFESPNFVLHNESGQRFSDLSAASPTALGLKKVSRGLVLDDFDGDGRVDVVILDLNSRPQVLRNQSQGIGAFLQFRLVGTHSARCPAGAKVVVRNAGTEQVAELALGRGYQGHFGTVVHFGLGAEHRATVQCEVTWPGGHRQTFDNLSTGRRYTLVEDQNSPVE